MSDSRSPDGTGFPRVVGGRDRGFHAAPPPPHARAPCVCHQAFTFLETGVFLTSLSTPL